MVFCIVEKVVVFKIIPMWYISSNHWILLYSMPLLVDIFCMNKKYLSMTRYPLRVSIRFELVYFLVLHLPSGIMVTYVWYVLTEISGILMW